MKRMIPSRLRVAIPVACLLALGSSPARTATDDEVRPPAVAGQFYPRDAAGLAEAIDAYLASARAPATARPVALVVPHAGYVFSGQIAADAYRQSAGYDYDTVVILGTNHTDASFRRIALYRGRGFRTPLGVAEIDTGLATALIEADPDVAWRNETHAREHSVEVQVPFVQRLFPKAKILPLVVATSDPAMCARLGRALAGLVAGRRALVVASSDLSHYPAASDARRIDRETLEAIAGMDAATVETTLAETPRRGVRELVTGACGEAPILAAIAYARALDVTRGRIVSYANSADSPAGDPRRVVGYGALTFAPDDDGANGDGKAGAGAAGAIPPLSDADKQALLDYAKRTIERFVRTGTAPLSRDVDAALMQRRGAFVTIREHGELRGCIGRLVPDGPLHWLVGAVALQAATGDPRFSPVRAKELANLEVEVSILTPMREIASPAEIVVGRDGVVMVKDGKSAVFLPEVATDEGWTREMLLDNLSLKAGLPAGAWRAGARFAVFQSEVVR
jgi:AmmeMemoRadiSam system protein B/AmmeMemoRadiSam system protein A